MQRHEYEDPQQPGALKTKIVHVDDAVINVRAPLSTGVRFLAVYRKVISPANAAAIASPPDKTLLARISLPEEVTR